MNDAFRIVAGRKIAENQAHRCPGTFDPLPAAQHIRIAPYVVFPS